MTSKKRYKSYKSSKESRKREKKDLNQATQSKTAKATESLRRLFHIEYAKNKDEFDYETSKAVYLEGQRLFGEFENRPNLARLALKEDQSDDEDLPILFNGDTPDLSERSKEKMKILLPFMLYVRKEQTLIHKPEFELILDGNRNMIMGKKVDYACIYQLDIILWIYSDDQELEEFDFLLNLVAANQKNAIEHNVTLYKAIGIRRNRPNDLLSESSYSVYALDFDITDFIQLFYNNRQIPFSKKDLEIPADIICISDQIDTLLPSILALRS